MQEAKPHSREGGQGGAAVAVIAVICFMLPLGYCLSLGPAIWFVERTGMNEDSLEMIYAPLAWLYNNVQFLQPIFDFYIGLWSDKG